MLTPQDAAKQVSNLIEELSREQTEDWYQEFLDDVSSEVESLLQALYEFHEEDPGVEDP